MNFGHAAHLIEEVHVPRAAPEFPVRDSLQPSLLLHAHGFTYGFILDLTQLLRRYLIAACTLSRLQKPRRTQQAADMIAPKGRLQAFQCSLRMKFVILIFFGAAAGPNAAYTNGRHAPNEELD